ncbi:polyprenyl synthetase family protein [Ornithinimicrobium pekingense]|uniref:Geranylgeranyl pyrophosphate synthase n=1 Tax=Ornithinimicrobium pekingense TaxID=384677 RepID=A0ABQ2F7H5_9MICO|nr:polyprenyl synthetase family protein [Ornithinimicrobium pekingense]GGK69513.1 geranylgeranyl pyrophosphate synthase [Ornithinimicrobium pekingense]
MAHAHPLDGGLRPRVQQALTDHLDRQREVLAELGAPMGPLVDAVDELLAGGKRLRAAFFYWGWRALGHDEAHDEAAVRAASSMEIFQAAALLHDDVMDNSDLRRGRPTAHRAFAADHRRNGWNGDPARFGHAAAILAGDLCLNWTDEVFSTSGLPPEALRRARPEFDRMRTQLMGGQFLDMLEGAQGWSDLAYEERVARSRTVIRYKSAKYSVEQPLLIGAHAAGATAATLRSLSRYGTSLGEAFQLRDDVLGVFGDPDHTGKPAGDDLREGKHTALVAHTLELADGQDAELVAASLGDPDLDDATVEACRRVIRRSGALERTERMIADGAEEARRALADTEGPTDEGRAALHELIAICTDRQT